MSSSSKPFILVTGLSGAGRSTALRILEDAGFYCMDNIPYSFFEYYLQKQFSKKQKVPFAFGMDERSPNFFKELEKNLSYLRKKIPHLKILFLTSSELVLIRRFSETRRKHPLSKKGNLLAAIRKEKKLSESIRLLADYYIDTTYMNGALLKAALLNLLDRKQKPIKLPLSLLSFGYRYGIPPQCDLTFDVRFLPNPYFNPALKMLNGTNRKVQSFVLKRVETKKFIRHITQLLNFLIPQYAKEGKSYLTLAFGCTGGKHRSVSLAEYFKEYFEKKNFWVDLDHRDIYRG